MPDNRWRIHRLFAVMVLVSALLTVVLVVAADAADENTVGPVSGTQSVKGTGGSGCPSGEQTFPVTETRSGRTLTVTSPAGTSSGPISADGKTADATGPGGSYHVVAETSTRQAVVEVLGGCRYEGTISLNAPLPLLAGSPTPVAPPAPQGPRSNSATSSDSGGGSLTWLWVTLLGVGVLATVVGLYMMMRRRDKPKPRCRFALLVGVGFPEQGEEASPEKSADAQKIVKDAEKIKLALVDGWGFDEKQVERKTLLNSQAKKKFIEDAFKDLLGEIENLSPNCESCYVKIHFQGHATRKDPAGAVDIFKGVKPPGDGKSHVAFRTWDNPKNLGNKGLVFDFELTAKVTELRDALAAQKKTNKKLKDTRVIVQVDMCYAKSMVTGVLGAAGVSAAWSSGPGCAQSFPAKHGSPWAAGFYSAFADAESNVDTTKNPSIEDAHKAAANNTNAYGPKQDDPFKPEADYDGHGQTPAMHPKD
jgi:hypothetical protein